MSPLADPPVAPKSNRSGKDQPTVPVVADLFCCARPTLSFAAFASFVAVRPAMFRGKPPKWRKVTERCYPKDPAEGVVKSQISRLRGYVRLCFGAFHR